MPTFRWLLLAAMVALHGFGVSRPASAQCTSSIDECGYMPRSAFFLSLGGSFDSVNFGDQDVIAIGTSEVTDENSVIQATGSARGPDDASGGTPIAMDSQVSFAPTVELGFFQHFAGSESGLWGVKFSNEYFGVTSDVRLPRFPQVGEFTYVTDPGTPVPFTGNAVALSTQTEIVDQIAFRPFLGHSFDRGFVYFGGGPTLSLLQTDIQDLVGFADIQGNHSNISGVPQDFSDSDWVWGGSAQVGVTYFFDRSWFLDCSYILSVSSKHTFDFASTFSHTADDGTTNAGTLVGSSTWQAFNQGISFKIGRAF